MHVSARLATEPVAPDPHSEKDRLLANFARVVHDLVQAGSSQRGILLCVNRSQVFVGQVALARLLGLFARRRGLRHLLFRSPARLLLREALPGFHLQRKARRDRRKGTRGTRQRRSCKGLWPQPASVESRTGGTAP